jgi:hypothetical protein
MHWSHYLRVGALLCRYAFCPNLTIIDTPGFILKAKSGEADNTPDESGSGAAWPSRFLSPTLGF